MHLITVQPDNHVFACRDDQFVIEAMIRAQCGPIHHGCCGGGCGVCRMRVLNGAYEIVKRMSAAHISEQDLADNIVLICCIQPRADLTLTRV